MIRLGRARSDDRSAISVAVVVAEDDLQHRVAELGKEITADYAGRAPLLVGVLKGAFMFMADLARAIDLPVEFDFMAVSSYGSATKTSGVVRIVKDLDLDLTGRDVIAGRGHRRQRPDPQLPAARTCGPASPASLEVCALLAARRASRRSSPTLRYVGLPHPRRVRRRLRPRRRRALPQPARTSAPTWVPRAA